MKVIKFTKLQIVIRSMTNWQNSQWLRHANDLHNIDEAKKYSLLKRNA